MASLPFRLFIVSVTVLAAMSVRADVTDTAAERQFFLPSATVKLTLQLSRKNETVDLIRHLEQHGCTFHRKSANHTVYRWASQHTRV
jgi:hypothetical protein